MTALVSVAAFFGLWQVKVLGATNTLIDPGTYGSDAEAQAAWKGINGSRPVAMTSIAGRRALMFSCDFSGGSRERGVWDKATALNLRSSQAVAFDFLCPDPAPVSYFSVYFESGDGWYHGMFYPEKPGVWTTISIAKSAFVQEGQPAGWDKISGIRLSAWRGGNKDTTFHISDLRQVGVLGADARVAVLRAASIAEASVEQKRTVDRHSDTVAGHLNEVGVRCAVLDDTDLDGKLLSQARLVILPFNASIPRPALNALTDYLSNGGKVLGFHALPEPLVAAGPIRRGTTGGAADESRLASIHQVDGLLPGAPPHVLHSARNLADYQAIPGHSRVLAEWRGSDNKPGGLAAVVASSNLVAVSHLMPGNASAEHRRLLLALCGVLDGEVWREGAEAALANLGRISSYENFNQAHSGISTQGKVSAPARAALSKARALYDEASKQAQRKQYIQSTETTAAAAAALETAFCAAQEPRSGEFRAFWCHSAFGVKGMTWDEAVRRLATNGFTAILPNMLWGGAAYYDSETLPRAKDLGTRGDQIAECLAACRKYGVELHVWKVNWNLGHTVPESFLKKMREEARLQKSFTGKEEPWLCPSHPENQKLEIASMVELARRYELDGIHFDYIRYPDTEHCYCNGCKERFSTSQNVRLASWPSDVREGGSQREAWLDWRRANITTVVKAVSQQARAVRPRLKISAAVFPNWNTDRDRIGQDWVLWCKEGYLDFVCPMDYTPSNNNFSNLVEKQVAWAGKVPCYPGIGVSASSSHFGADKVIDQIKIARNSGAGGFVIFNYAVPESTELLPKLGLGITSRR